MKTATFEYTHKTEVDSSLAEAIYYNAENKTMAIQFNSKSGMTTGSAIYDEVPKAFYDGFVTVSSIGRTYNGFVKVTFPNISEGTVYGVKYVLAGTPIEGEKDASVRDYVVSGHIRHTQSYRAESAKAASQMFIDTLVEEGYDVDELVVTEVELSFD